MIKAAWRLSRFNGFTREKPLKRFVAHLATATGLKPGVNERAVLIDAAPTNIFTLSRITHHKLNSGPR